MAERLRVEPVAGEDRHILPVGDVTGRAPAAHVVVIHRRQVVVDQRVGVDQLERRGQRQHLVAGHADRGGRRQREHRTDALASGEQ